MEYNNYYPSQSGHPPPPVTNQHHGGPQMQQQPPPGGQMMHAPMPPHNIRQAMPPGPPSHHQQMQQLQQQQQPQQLGHHPQQMPPQQQHSNYHQIQPSHPHGMPVTHSGSPHPQQPQQHHNHQPALSGPSPQQPVLPSHHMHPQSPHLHNGPPMHIQQQQQPQIQQMVRPPIGPSVMNHLQPGIPQPPHHHQQHHQNFFTGGSIHQSNMHHYPQQNQHHSHHQPQHNQQHPHHQPPMMHHPPQMATHHTHIHQSIGRNSPYYPSILQTEFRIIELNRRLQSRPISRHPVSPLPSSYDESPWWEKFASEFFEDDATLTLRMLEDKPIEYTIGRKLIPRFFRACFENGGITDLSINLRNPKETCMHPQMITLDCDQTAIITNNNFKHTALATNQSVFVHTEGHLILDFVSNNFDTLSIKSWKFYATGCREYIDRSLAAMGLPNAFLADSVAKQGFTKSTVFYLKMCKLIEPMQDLMILHKQTKEHPRACLKKLLFDRHKFRSGEDNRVATNKRRKRKPSAAPAVTGVTMNKKSKVNLNNPLGNNGGLNNNIMMSPSGAPGFSLASQDVMVVGEPSMMGGDFGDDNERMITRLENTQYDPIASTPLNAEETDLLNTSAGTEHTMSNNSNNVESNIENHNMSPSLLQHRQQQQPQSVPQLQQQLQPQQQPPPMSQEQQQQPQQPQQQAPPSSQVMPRQTSHENDQSSQQEVEQQVTTQRQQLIAQENSEEESTSSQINQISLIENTNLLQQQEVGDLLSQQSGGDRDEHEDLEHLANEEDLNAEGIKSSQNEINQNDLKLNSITGTIDDANAVIGVHSVERMDQNHSNSIQPLNEESNSNSQLPCSTASTTSAMEQQQPVDNGVA